jgi:hypothetical protein
MVKKAAAKIAWVGRTASMVFGLALVLALIFGVATMALAGTGVGGVFNLGQTNTVNAVTKLVGSVAGPSLQIDNNSTNAQATALDLQVEPNKPPMKVNRTTKVTNLNADLLDGKDSSAIGRELWAVVGSNGSFVRGNGVNGTAKLQTGAYVVEFNRSVVGCAYTATTSNGSAGPTGVDEGTDQPGFTAQQVIVFTVATNGTNADLPFHLIVAC